MRALNLLSRLAVLVFAIQIYRYNQEASSLSVPQPSLDAAFKIAFDHYMDRWEKLHGLVQSYTLAALAASVLALVTGMRSRQTTTPARVDE